MPSYTPPLRDMQFVMNEVLDVPAVLKSLPTHADLDADTISAVLEINPIAVARSATASSSTPGAMVTGSMPPARSNASRAGEVEARISLVTR